MKTLFQLSEAVEKHHVTSFTRMNPPHDGHMKLIDKVHSVAGEHKADHSVVVSHSQDSKKNPLSSAQKIKHLRRFSPKTNVTASSTEHPTILHHLAALHKKGVTHLHLVAGSDRHVEMHKLVNSYNGKKSPHGHYNFKSINVHSSGERDPDSAGTTGASATKQREHAASGNFKEFRKGVPSHVSDKHAQDLMNDVHKGMQTKNEEMEMEPTDDLLEIYNAFSDEELWNTIDGMQEHELDPNENDVEFVDILIGEEFDEEEKVDESRVLTVLQRQKARIRFRTRGPSLKRMRAVKRKRMATTQRLQYRSRVGALMMLRKRVAGQRGAAYHKLTPAQRYTIDKTVKQRYGKGLDKLVGSISRRMIPLIRRKEMSRLARARGQKSTALIAPQVMMASYDMNEMYLLTPKVNLLLRLGLVDQDEIQTYRRALAAGEKSLASPELRSKILSMLDKILKLATEDPQAFSRIRAMVIQKKQKNEEVEEAVNITPSGATMSARAAKRQQRITNPSKFLLRLRNRQLGTSTRFSRTPTGSDKIRVRNRVRRLKRIRGENIDLQANMHEAVNPEAERRRREAQALKDKHAQERAALQAKHGKTSKPKKSGGGSTLGLVGRAVFGNDKQQSQAAGALIGKGYNWLKNKLTNEYDPLLEDKIAQSLYNKSMKHNISIDKVLEIYNNKMNESGNEESAFNAVNSFLANLDEVLDTPERKHDYVHKAFKSGNELQAKANKESDSEKKKTLAKLSKRNQSLIKVAKGVTEATVTRHDVRSASVQELMTLSDILNKFKKKPEPKYAGQERRSKNRRDPSRSDQFAKRYKGVEPRGNDRRVGNLQPQAEVVRLDRDIVPNYPNDPATIKHQLETAHQLLSDPALDSDSRAELEDIIARMEDQKPRLKRMSEYISVDRTKVPNYPNDPATIKHKAKTVNQLLADPKTDPASRRAASAIFARNKPKTEEVSGAGEEGTNDLIKKYANDTPGQHIETLNIKKADMGAVIKDFQDSDAPQFRGKSLAKIRQMAIAAKLSSQEKE